ncbi:S1 family peptidase [Paenibacillus whitsoniae]|uniref:S1 family peptidase n=1 Tax=Paenibacillus whitsoniae TaxID=2496558 RepID=UPI001F496031|nr:S1 family peptidase [Paenibacillus whitsoniae]
MATFHEALRHKKRIAHTLLKRPEVTAIGVGYVDPHKPALGASVIVYTQKKIVPSSMNGLRTVATQAGASSAVPVRFVASGTFKCHALLTHPKIFKPATFRSRIRPVPGGVSVGKANPAATGTAGLIVTKNNQLYVLSNNHVLIKDNSPLYSATLQPGPADGGTLASDQLGRAYQFVPLQNNAVNYQDSAIAVASNQLLNPRYQVTSSGSLITVPGHVLSYSVGAQLVKSGRTTGFVRGTVEANHVDVRVSYGGRLGTLLFRNQSVIRGNNGPVSLPGDSGSVWLRASDRYAAALNFAGTPDGTRSISNPIALIMSTYGIRVAVPVAGGFKAGGVRSTAVPRDASAVQPLSQIQKKRVRAQFVRSTKA